MSKARENRIATCSCGRLQELLERYGRIGKPIPIDFREEGRRLPKADRSRHFVHPYPAKLLLDIPRFFLSNKILSNPGDVVFDPFCGTGTVLLEAAANGRSWVGADANPLARLITRVKLSSYSGRQIRETLRVIISSAKKSRTQRTPDVVNIDHWYTPRIKRALARLSKAVSETAPPNLRDFFDLCLSLCVRDLSNADPRLSVPVFLRISQYPIGHPLRKKTRQRIEDLKTVCPIEHFAMVAERLMEILKTDKERLCQGRAPLIVDAREIVKQVGLGSVDLIITSPPYLGAQKYIRASSLSLGWLRLAERTDLRSLEEKIVGREHFGKKDTNEDIGSVLPHADTLIKEVFKANRLRAKIASKYLQEMDDILSHLYASLKQGGHLVLVVGNNHLCGRAFPTERYLRQLAVRHGFSIRLRLVDNIKSRGLMTKRNKTADLISREWVIVMQKGTKEL